MGRRLPPDGPIRPDAADPGDPIGPRPPRPPRPPIPWSPFGPGDNANPDVAQIEARAAHIRAALEKAQRELTGMRHGPGPDGTPPVVEEVSRADGLWPFLVIRTYPGDVGKRPFQASDTVSIWTNPLNSPDVILTNAGPSTEQRVIGRDGIPALKARELHSLKFGVPYDVWVHVWNLGHFQATGVRVRARLGPVAGFVYPVALADRFLDGIALDLGDRTSETAHVVVKAATFTAEDLHGYYWMLVTATADCLTDPATGDLAPGADRHSAHCAISIHS